MLNQVILVGRLVNIGGDTITLACPRSYKNAQGEYETDFIKILLSKNILEKTLEYCKTGDVIGIRGCVQCTVGDDGDGHTTYVPQIIADKITFLKANNNN